MAWFGLAELIKSNSMFEMLESFSNAGKCYAFAARMNAKTGSHCDIILSAMLYRYCLSAEQTMWESRKEKYSVEKNIDRPLTAVISLGTECDSRENSNDHFAIVIMWTTITVGQFPCSNSLWPRLMSIDSTKSFEIFIHAHLSGHKHRNGISHVRLEESKYHYIYWLQCNDPSKHRNKRNKYV